jgi:hypothetical protein
MVPHHRQTSPIGRLCSHLHVPEPDNMLNMSQLLTCLQMLRQALMCAGDIGLLTYNWVKDNPTPFPDFDTTHRCRNFTKLLEWGESTAIIADSVDVFDSNDRLGIKLLDGDD